MNIRPEFISSKEWRKFERIINDRCAWGLIVNLFFQMERITRDRHDLEAHTYTKSSEDIADMCNAYSYNVDPDELVDALLKSELMIDEGDDYRVVAWELENSNLIKNRANGYRSKKQNTTQQMGRCPQQAPHRHRPSTAMAPPPKVQNCDMEPPF